MGEAAGLQCEGCSASVDGKLECPTCKASGARRSYFCNQTCFRKTWARHKLTHGASRNGETLVGGGASGATASPGLGCEVAAAPARQTHAGAHPWLSVPF